MKCILAITFLMVVSAICQQCPEREVFKTCGTACPETCTNYKMIRSGEMACIEVCRQGCFCEQGLVRDETSGKCVPTTQCAQPKKCDDVREVYKTCGTACPKTCKNFDKNIDCIDVCREGCFCEEPYVRNDEGKCVVTDDCLVKPIHN